MTVMGQRRRIRNRQGGRWHMQPPGRQAEKDEQDQKGALHPF